MLDLNDPKPEELEEPGRPRLRLVPKGPRVAFRWVEEPETPWRVRAVSILLALVLTSAGVIAILLTAALLKEVYDQVDAADQARAVERARVRSAKEAAAKPRDDGAIVLSLPGEQAPRKSQPVKAKAPPTSP